MEDICVRGLGPDQSEELFRVRGRNRLFVSSNSTKDCASDTPGVILSKSFAENSMNDIRFLCFSVDEEDGILFDLESLLNLGLWGRPLSPLSPDCRRLLEDLERVKIGCAVGREYVDEGLGRLETVLFLEVIARKPEEKKSE